MKVLVRNRHFWLMLGADVCLLAAAYYLAHWLRFEGAIPGSFLSLFASTVTLVVAVKILCFFYFNLYRGMWRYTSLADFVNVFKAVGVSTVVLVLILLFTYGFPGFSRSVFILDFLLTLVFIAGIRLGIRLYLTRGYQTFAPGFWRKSATVKRLLLIGAGNTGEHVLREMMDNPSIRMQPVGFRAPGRHQVGDEAAACDPVVGDQAAMAAPPQCLGAHHARGPRIGGLG